VGHFTVSVHESFERLESNKPNDLTQGPFWNPRKAALQHHLLVGGCQWDWLSWRTRTSRHQWPMCWGGHGRVISPRRSCPSYTSDALRYRVGLHYWKMMIRRHKKKNSLLKSTWRLTPGWKVPGSIPNAHSVTRSILYSRNLKHFQSTDKIQSYSYLWSITDKRGLEYLSLLPVGPVPLSVHTPPRLTSYRRLIHSTPAEVKWDILL
jgi:hypothetical protein